MFKKYQQIHFVGIGGIGMSGIAEVLINLGYRVTGSDLKSSETTMRLAGKGARIFFGHDAANVNGAHVVVVSSAVKGSNPEVREAINRGIAVVPRAEMLSELMRLKYAVAVAGTHGKTSTTSLIGCVLDHAGFDPTLIIGGKVNSLRSNARLGKGEFLVAEADESDRSFLKLDPTIAVVTNIDREHMENYRDFDDLKGAFLEFANKVPFYGAVVACSAHPVVARMVPKISRTCVTYAEKNADYTVRSIRQKFERVSFEALYRGISLGKFSLAMVGKHYAMNALATIAVASHLDISPRTIREAFGSFKGIARRFEILARSGPIVVDDYAHHPVEIAATILAARAAWPKKRLVTVIQPHRYSRVATHFDAFVSVFEKADSAVVMDIYPAGEAPRKNVTGERLWRGVCRKFPKKRIFFAPTGEEAIAKLCPLVEKGDVVLFMGAGSVTQTARAFAKTLSSCH